MGVARLGGKVTTLRCQDALPRVTLCSLVTVFTTSPVRTIIHHHSYHIKDSVRRLSHVRMFIFGRERTTVATPCRHRSCSHQLATCTHARLSCASTQICMPALTLALILTPPVLHIHRHAHVHTPSLLPLVLSRPRGCVWCDGKGRRLTDILKVTGACIKKNQDEGR